MKTDLLVGGDVEHGGSRVSLLDGKGQKGIDEFDGRIEAAGIAGVIVFVAAIQGRVDLRLVVLAHVDGDVEVGGVAVGKTPEGHHVAVQVLRFHTWVKVQGERTKTW